MPRPLIGITTRNGRDSDGHPTIVLQHAYINAVREAGGLPVPLPCNLPEDLTLSLYSQMDGLIFSGGGDIALEHFEGVPHSRIEGVDAARDGAELALAREAAAGGKPMLGICRGAQMMNVALGGTLYTHIPAQVPNALDHDYPGSLRRELVHAVEVEPDSFAADVFGRIELQVNSLHHQGLKDLAPGLRAAGRSPDGLVEVVELTGHPYAIAVQWHPEWLTDQPAMQRLFQSLVEAAHRSE